MTELMKKYKPGRIDKALVKALIVLVALTAVLIVKTEVWGEALVSNDETWVYISGDYDLKYRTCGEYVYTDREINLRGEPMVFSEVLKVAPINARLLKVADGGRWIIVQVEGINYFALSAFVTEEIPDEVTDWPVKEEKAVTEPQGGSIGQCLGTFTLTAFCPGSCCCGKWAGSRTSSGTWPTAGRTVASNEIPAGTRIYIEGMGYYTVEDTGWSPYSPWIDIFFDTHSEAQDFGIRTANVYLAG